MAGVEVDPETCRFARGQFQLEHVVPGLFPDDMFILARTQPASLRDRWRRLRPLRIGKHYRPRIGNLKASNVSCPIEAIQSRPRVLRAIWVEPQQLWIVTSSETGVTQA